MAQEDQELLVPVPWFAYSGTWPVAISSAANKVVVRCRTQSWVRFSACPGGEHRQRAYKAVARRYCINREAVAVKAASRKRRQLGQALQRVQPPYGR